MSENKKRQTVERLAELRRRVAAGDLHAHCELWIELLEGIQDLRGRSVIRRNPAYGVRLLRSAAEGGTSQGYDSLAYAYDVGLGVRTNRPEAERRSYCYQYGIGVKMNLSEARTLYRRAMSSGHITPYFREEAMYGLAVSFVDLGQNARAVPLLKAASADEDYRRPRRFSNRSKGRKRRSHVGAGPSFGRTCWGMRSVGSTLTS
jgi:TPR repeat protein